MKKSSKTFWGLALIAIGVILALNALGVVNITLFFPGWWTLFIILPCLQGLVTDDDKAADLTGLIIGVVLLLACLNVISFEILWKMILPVILVFIGAALIFGKTEVKFFSRDSSHKDYKKSTKKIKEAKIKK